MPLSGLPSPKADPQGQAVPRSTFHDRCPGGLLPSVASTSRTLSSSEPASPLAPSVPPSLLTPSLGLFSGNPLQLGLLPGPPWFERKTTGQQQSSVSSKAGQTVGRLQGQGLPCPLSSLTLGQSLSISSSRKEPSNGRGVSLRSKSPWLSLFQVFLGS